MPFQIDWNVPEQEWEDAAKTAQQEKVGGRYDRQRLAKNWLLYGQMQFEHDSQLLFPSDRLLKVEEIARTNLIEMGDPWYPLPHVVEFGGVNISIIDAAYSLAEKIDQSSFKDTDVASVGWKIEEGDLRFTFSKAGRWVSIRTNLFDNIELRVPEDEFFGGVETFLRDVARAISDHVPELLEWDTFASLRPYVG